MECLKIGRFEAAKKYQRRQMLVDNMILYVVAPLVCTLFCSSPLWFPFLCSFLKGLLLVTLPELGSVFLTTKSLFIVGNLIVAILVRESKIFASSSPSPPGDHSDAYYDEYVMRRHSLINNPTVVDKKEVRLENPFVGNVVETYQDEEKCQEEQGEDMDLEDYDDYGDYGDGDDQEEEEDEDEEVVAVAFPAEDLNRRADDFIARVNKQRRLEASLFICSPHI